MFGSDLISEIYFYYISQLKIFLHKIILVDSKLKVLNFQKSQNYL